MEAELVPPQNLEAETCILGSMLLDEEAKNRAMELLSEDSFYSTSHKKIFSASMQLSDKNKPLDLITLSEELRNKGLLDEVGGASYLTNLTESVPTTSNVEHYANIVREKKTLRDLINAASRIIGEGYKNPEDVDAFLDKSEQDIFNLSQQRIQQDYVPIKELIPESLEMAEALSQDKRLITGLATGFHKFDEMTAGLHPSELIVLAGRPSIGKSSLAMNIAVNAAIRGQTPVAIFSLEMSREQLVQRMLCSEARVNAHHMRTGFLDDSAFPRLASAAGLLSESLIFIDDTPGIPIFELRAKSRRLRAKEKIGLIIIDYLQLMRGGARIENRQQEISEISHSLKALARELRIPVMALSQLSRAVEARTDHKPQLSDLRESGAIEQDADLVALLAREDAYVQTEENRGKAELNIAKQRNGPIGSVPLTFLMEYMRFETRSERDID